MYKFLNKFKKNKILYSIFVFFRNKLTYFSRKKKSNYLKNNGEYVSYYIDNILEKNSIDYFYACGSLLGIIREGKFLENDNDIDYGIIYDESFSWEEFEKLLTLNGLKKIRQFEYKGNITEQTYFYKNISIDFFMYTSDQNYSTSYVYYKRKDISYNKSTEFSVVNLEVPRIYSTKKIMINDRYYRVPINEIEYLTSLYTDNWRIPDKNWKDYYSPAWKKYDLETIVEIINYEI